MLWADEYQNPHHYELLVQLKEECTDALSTYFGSTNIDGKKLDDELCRFIMSGWSLLTENKRMEVMSALNVHDLYLQSASFEHSKQYFEKFGKKQIKHYVNWTPSDPLFFNENQVKFFEKFWENVPAAYIAEVVIDKENYYSNSAKDLLFNLAYRNPYKRGVLRKILLASKNIYAVTFCIEQLAKGQNAISCLNEDIGCELFCTLTYFNPYFFPKKFEQYKKAMLQFIAKQEGSNNNSIFIDACNFALQTDQHELNKCIMKSKNVGLLLESAFLVRNFSAVKVLLESDSAQCYRIPGLDFFKKQSKNLPFFVYFLNNSHRFSIKNLFDDSDVSFDSVDVRMACMEYFLKKVFGSEKWQENNVGYVSALHAVTSCWNMFKVIPIEFYLNLDEQTGWGQKLFDLVDKLQERELPSIEDDTSQKIKDIRDGICCIARQFIDAASIDSFRQNQQLYALLHVAENNNSFACHCFKEK